MQSQDLFMQTGHAGNWLDRLQSDPLGLPVVIGALGLAALVIGPLWHLLARRREPH